MANFDSAVNGMIGIAEIGIIGGMTMGIMNNMMRGPADRTEDNYSRKKVSKKKPPTERQAQSDDLLRKIWGV
jgi:hypothetical protein